VSGFSRTVNGVHYESNAELAELAENLF